MGEFYHDPDGKVRFRALAGGTGGGATGFFDAPVTDTIIASNPLAYAAFMASVPVEAAEPSPESALQPAPVITPDLTVAADTADTPAAPIVPTAPLPASPAIDTPVPQPSNPAAEPTIS